MPLTSKKIGFIGAGAMAEAMLKSILRSDLIPGAAIYTSDVNGDRGRYLTEQYGINFLSKNQDLVKKSDIVVYAVKPYMMGEVLGEISNYACQQQVHISIAAGIKLDFIEQNLPEGIPVVRVMPNTASLIGAGASAYALGRFAGTETEKTVRTILDSTGVSVKVPEHLINAVTGLSGSGPAYVFVILEALIDGAVKAGLLRETAGILAAQTLVGAAKMFQESGKHPAVLRDMVTTPGGTTMAALHVLERGKLRATIMDAVLAAAQRADELGAVK
jgi:pyrroline-5-carboxylate reductase